MATAANPNRTAWNMAAQSARDKNASDMNRAEMVFSDRYRCPEEFINIGVLGKPSEHAGFFRFGPETLCYGRCSAFAPAHSTKLTLNDALEHVTVDQGAIALPFDVTEAVSALRYERYVRNGNGYKPANPLAALVRAGYYAVRPAMPVAARKYLQRYWLRNWDRHEFPHWPVDTSVENIIESVMTLSVGAQKTQEIPFIWFWPDNAQACVVMTHDVETAAGRDFCGKLMDIDDSSGIKSSFQIVPEQRYAVPDSYLQKIKDRGFEVNVHDLNHDGKLFQNYEEFSRRASSINRHGKAFGALGFRSAILYRHIDWIKLLDFQYDTSIPNVAHLDPQHGGCCTIFPYFIGDVLEIPVTMIQDYSLFHILQNYSLDLWKIQMSLILERHGVMNFIIHPDYISKENEQRVYRDLLSLLSQLRDTAGCWIPLPSELNKWWRQRSQMKLVRKNGSWEIVGEGKDRARVAFARLENGNLYYSLTP